MMRADYRVALVCSPDTRRRTNCCVLCIDLRQRSSLNVAARISQVTSGRRELIDRSCRSSGRIGRASVPKHHRISLGDRDHLKRGLEGRNTGEGETSRFTRRHPAFWNRRRPETVERSRTIAKSLVRIRVPRKPVREGEDRPPSLASRSDDEPGERRRSGSAREYSAASCIRAKVPELTSPATFRVSSRFCCRPSPTPPVAPTHGRGAWCIRADRRSRRTQARPTQHPRGDRRREETLFLGPRAPRK